MFLWSSDRKGMHARDKPSASSASTAVVQNNKRASVARSHSHTIDPTAACESFAPHTFQEWSEKSHSVRALNPLHRRGFSSGKKINRKTTSYARSDVRVAKRKICAGLRLIIAIRWVKNASDPEKAGTKGANQYPSPSARSCFLLLGMCLWALPLCAQKLESTFAHK